MPPAAMIELRDDEALESLPDGLRVIRRRAGYRHSVDPLLLTEFTRVRRGEAVIDLGTGSAILLLLLAKKGRPKRMVGVELKESLCDLALRNVRLNGLEGLITIINRDVRRLRDDLEGSSFDLVVSNPPFRSVTSGRISPHPERAIARHELALMLPELLDISAYLLRPGGRLGIIYAAPRMADLVWELRSKGLEPKRLQVVHHRVETPASLLLVEAVKGGGAGLELLPPRILA